MLPVSHNLGGEEGANLWFGDQVLISWILLLILVLKSKGTVKIPTMHILYLIGSSTEQTRTHVYSVSSMNGPLEQPRNF